MIWPFKRKVKPIVIVEVTDSLGSIYEKADEALREAGQPYRAMDMRNKVPYRLQYVELDRYDRVLATISRYCTLEMRGISHEMLMDNIKPMTKEEAMRANVGILGFFDL